MFDLGGREGQDLRLRRLSRGTTAVVLIQQFCGIPWKFDGMPPWNTGAFYNAMIDDEKVFVLDVLWIFVSS